MRRLEVRVIGRPAPQGSHDVGEHGYVMHSSKYLKAWRHAVNRDTRKAYVAAGLTGDDMPLIPYPESVVLWIEHVVLDEQCAAAGTVAPTGSPDVDKLTRATIDGLGEARAFTNDSQVVLVTASKRRRNRGEDVGALIKIETLDASKGDQTVGTFTPTGEYRVVLEKIVIDGDGDRTWDTVIEVTDLPENIASTWLPALAARLGGEPAVDAASESPKPQTKRPRKTTPAAAQAPAQAPEAPAPAPTVPEQPSAPQTPAEAASVPTAAPARVNPFARG